VTSRGRAQKWRAGDRLRGREQKVANADPAGFGEHGSYKIPFFVPRGTTVTVTIDPRPAGTS
jgi:hypothetical protein